MNAIMDVKWNIETHFNSQLLFDRLEETINVSFHMELTSIADETIVAENRG